MKINRVKFPTFTLPKQSRKDTKITKIAIQALSTSQVEDQKLEDHTFTVGKGASKLGKKIEASVHRRK